MLPYLCIVYRPLECLRLKSCGLWVQSVPTAIYMETPQSHSQFRSIYDSQMQTNEKALMYMEVNLDPKTIPSTLIALLLSPERRKALLDQESARKFLQSNTCLVKFLETLKAKPGVMSSNQQDMASMFAGKFPRLFGI